MYIISLKLNIIFLPLYYRESVFKFFVFVTTDVDECLEEPCKNAVSCRNLEGDYECECRAGWVGKDCQTNINDCYGQCLNGATCIDLVDDYHCACANGFRGM